MSFVDEDAQESGTLVWLGSSNTVAPSQDFSVQNRTLYSIVLPANGFTLIRVECYAVFSWDAGALANIAKLRVFLDGVQMDNNTNNVELEGGADDQSVRIGATAEFSAPNGGTIEIRARYNVADANVHVTGIGYVVYGIV